MRKFNIKIVNPENSFTIKDGADKDYDIALNLVGEVLETFLKQINLKNGSKIEITEKG